MRDAAREMAPTQPQASSKLRDALSGMDQTDLTNRVQRTADWLRRGINPNANGTEAGISKDLDQLSQQVHQAQQGLGPGKTVRRPGSANRCARPRRTLSQPDRVSDGARAESIGPPTRTTAGTSRTTARTSWTTASTSRTTASTSRTAARSGWTVRSTSRELEQPRWPRRSDCSERRRESARGKPGRSG